MSSPNSRRARILFQLWDERFGMGEVFLVLGGAGSIRHECDERVDLFTEPVVPRADRRRVRRVLGGVEFLRWPDDAGDREGSTLDVDVLLLGFHVGEQFLIQRVSILLVVVPAVRDDEQVRRLVFLQAIDRAGSCFASVGLPLASNSSSK